MIEKIRGFGNDELIRGSLILFIMMGIFNFLNYIFHFSMARMLGPADYGILATLMSIIYIFSVPTEVIQTVITKYMSKFNIKKEYGKIKDLLYKSLKKGFILAFLIFVIFLAISIYLSSFLKIKFYLLFLTGLLIFYAFSVPIIRGILLGRKKFTELGLNMTLESSIKILLAVVLVLAGWRAYGAMVGILISGAITFLFASFLIKEILSSKRKRGNFKGIYSYSLPVFLAMLSVILIFSIDIILAKRFFPAELAGNYAVVSMLGKMIFLGTNPLGKAMFPFTSDRHERGKEEETRKLMKKSSKIVILISAIALFFYLFFPKLVIRILFGAEYVDAFGILFIIGLAFTLLSLSNIFILYNLSLNKTKKSFILLLFVALQITLLSLFHSSLLEFSAAFLIGNFLMFLYTLFSLRK